MSRVFITGDKHGAFPNLKLFCKQNETTTDDYMIILGDLGANFFLDKRDKKFKYKLNDCPITILAVHGNHEERPCKIPSYKYRFDEKIGCGVWYEDEYPNLLFLNDDEFIINGDNFLVLGGAYSVDKDYRLSKGLTWFPTEQMSSVAQERILKFTETEKQFRYVLSHTCPIEFEPTHLFLSMIDQSKVDKSMEIFLQTIYDRIDKDYLVRWFCGHFHSDEWIGPGVQMLYHDIIEITDFSQK